MTDEQIKHMVNRFLGWRLPENFSPDGGISFKVSWNAFPPIGTNLLDAAQAEVMVRYMVEGMPEPMPVCSGSEVPGIFQRHLYSGQVVNGFTALHDESRAMAKCDWPGCAVEGEHKHAGDFPGGPTEYPEDFDP